MNNFRETATLNENGACTQPNINGTHLILLNMENSNETPVLHVNVIRQENKYLIIDGMNRLNAYKHAGIRVKIVMHEV